ncbi:DUF6668 family protein [Streptomyces cyaneofuscatus]|uniref:DUF6668 family protein n=1 Tax=Streptomyces cyaneofuscatus TaxID=66883 RepID=UPI0033BC4487
MSAPPAPQAPSLGPSETVVLPAIAPVPAGFQPPPGVHRWARGPVEPPSPAVVPRSEPGPLAHPVPSYASGTAVSWVAAHGGAGVTTLAAALGGLDTGTRWPDPSSGEPGRMLVVARTHAAGIQAASTVLDALRTGSHPAGLELLGMVLVADAPGRLPLTLTRRIRVLRSAVTVHRVPWIPSWRLGARTAHLPKQVLALGRITGQADPYGPGV